MQSDRELLELAAKAAGIPLKPDFAERFDLYMADRLMWNPLISDGDALRLAVKLEIEVRGFNGSTHAGRTNKFWCTENWFPDGDPVAATRRAITRAAAQLAQAQEGK